MFSISCSSPLGNTQHTSHDHHLTPIIRHYSLISYMVLTMCCYSTPQGKEGFGGGPMAPPMTQVTVSVRCVYQSLFLGVCPLVTACLKLAHLSKGIALMTLVTVVTARTYTTMGMTRLAGEGGLRLNTGLRPYAKPRPRPKVPSSARHLCHHPHHHHRRRSYTTPQTVLVPIITMT